MSEPNKALVRSVINEVWNQHNPDAAAKYYSEDFVDHDPMHPTQGIDGLKDIVRMYVSAFPDVQFTVDDMVAEGDKVVMRWTAVGTHQGELQGIPPTGQKATVVGTTVSRIADGKVVEEWPVWDALGMLRQLGIVPEAEHVES